MSSIESNLLFGSSRLRNIENQAKSLIEVAEANIRQLTTQIGELTRVRERERSVLATLRLFILPIGKLPPELLVEIFKIVVHTPLIVDSNMPSWGLIPGDSGPALQKVLRLSQVSPYWRQLVHSTPQLWAEGVVGVNLNKELTDRYLDGLDTLLTRSSPYPISMSIGRGSDISAAPSKSSQTLARNVASTARRWENLQIDLDSLRHFNDLAPDTLEVLERLHVRNPRFAPVSDPILVFESSHRLRVFTLDAAASTIRLLRLPWLQLTHLQLHDASLVGCRTALLQCGNLIWAKILTSYDWDSPSPATDSPVTILPFLSTLDLEFQGVPNFDEVHGVEAFFLPLALPSLKILTLELDMNGEFWPTATFTDFQSRSLNIEDFTLRCSEVNSQELITLLRHSPALRSLEIKHCRDCIDAAFFNALCYEGTDSTPLVPKLDNLSLMYVGTFDNGPFEKAIRSRWWKDGEQILPDGSTPRISRLKAVSVEFDDFDPDDRFDDDLKARLQELVDQGLRLELNR
ncbi:hypothetical protein C8F04DRAFT_1132158 [Mycena alexandri]|uniref:F-box domain-containing protein n=1 Tax=Mycena alexandri TaxID=1745969 RepID=A0AAD6SB55_9AGAR|nr:hypothetical protein C8F04DRAFT_1132158 [Mycena alexandri]